MPAKPLIALVPSVSLALLAPNARAQTATVTGVDFARVNVLTVNVDLGATGSFDSKDASLDIRGGITGATLQFLGLDAKALDLQVAGRPNLGTTTLGASLLDVDAWMVGTSYFDSSLCFWRPGVLCDGSTGFWGLGGSVLNVNYDTGSLRTALRVGEIDLVGSPSPAFAAGWKKLRLLARVGATLDAVWAREDPTWLGRMALGLDALIRVGDYEARPSFRWRPSFGGFSSDYGLEAALGLFGIGTWKGLDAVGDTLRVGLEVGYAYWALPARSFGTDWLLGSRDTAFARVVVGASTFTAAPP